MVVTVTTIRRMFQSTHPRRVRRMASPVIWLPPVSIHAPTQGATSSSGSNTAPPALFNPRTHAGCDPLPPGRGRGGAMPIHAPTQGATPWLSKAERSAAFQSTHPRRVRRCWALRCVSGVVSIHAPTQGATRWTPGQRQRLGRFNPRTHAGCDCLFVTPSYCNKKRDVCEPHPGQFKTPRCRHHLSYRQTKQALTKSRTSTGKRHATYGSQDSLKHQGRIQIQHRLRTHMLDPIAPLPTQIVEPQTVLGRVDRFL